MWKLEDDDIFSVKSMYVKLEGRGLGEGSHPKGREKGVPPILEVWGRLQGECFCLKGSSRSDFDSH